MIASPVSFTDDSARREWFGEACRLVGGQRAMARCLDVSDRAVRAWCAGDRGISDGVMRDAVAVLRQHAADCHAHADHRAP